MAKGQRRLPLVDKVYLAKYSDVDGFHLMGSMFGMLPKTVEAIARRMRKNGEWDLYRSLSDEEYEKIIIAAERSEKA